MFVRERGPFHGEQNSNGGLQETVINRPRAVRHASFAREFPPNNQRARPPSLGTGGGRDARSQTARRGFFCFSHNAVSSATARWLRGEPGDIGRLLRPGGFRFFRENPGGAAVRL